MAMICGSAVCPWFDIALCNAGVSVQGQVKLVSVVVGSVELNDAQ